MAKKEKFGTFVLTRLRNNLVMTAYDIFLRMTFVYSLNHLTLYQNIFILFYFIFNLKKKKNQNQTKNIKILSKYSKLLLTFVISKHLFEQKLLSKKKFLRMSIMVSQFRVKKTSKFLVRIKR
jgi:hypothetical protein